MKKKLLLLSYALIFSGLQIILAQPLIKNFSDLNDVYSLHYANDTMWIGTSGGVVARDLNSGFKIAQILTVDSGLPSNFITSIVVDNKGTKWFGTFDRGLAAYNNGKWDYFNFSASQTNNIHTLAVDQSDNIWAGTADGAYFFDGTGWTPYNDNTTVTGDVLSIAVDGNNVWFATFGNGLFHFDGVNWLHETSSDGNIPSDNITAMAARNDSLLIGSRSGISFYDPNLSTWTTGVISAALDIDIFELEFGQFNQFYASTANGLYSWFNAVWTPESMLPAGPTGAIALRDFEIWIGFNKLGGGVLPYSFSTPPLPYEVLGSEYPGKNIVTDIVSHNGFVYAATYGNGISRYDGNIWEVFNANFDPIINNFANSLTMQADTLWIGTDNGVLTFDGEIWWLFTTSSPKINAVAVDKININKVWCGTLNGVSSFENGARTDYAVADLFNAEVIAIAIDTNNDVWFLHRNGLTRYHNNTFDLKIDLAGLGASSAELFDIAADLNNGIWVASSVGVIYYDNGTVNRYTDADGLADNRVLTVDLDSQNNKYFGTAGGGLSMYSPAGWQNLTRQNGIPMNRIKSVHFQATGSNIWIGGDWGGISQIHFNPLSVAANISSPQICLGNQITLNAIVSGGFGPGEYNYSWNSSNGDFSSTNQTETITPRENNTYLLEINDGFFSGSNSASLIVNTVDTSKIDGPAFVCTNSSTEIYSVTNNINKSYFWTLSGGNITTAPDLNEIIIDWDNNISKGTIFLNETDLNSDCSITQQFEVTFDQSPSPNIVRKGKNLIICTDSGRVSYQWYYNDVPVPGQDRQFYYVDNNLSLNAGTYMVEVGNQNQCKILSIPLEVTGTSLNIYPLPAKNILNIDFYSDILEEGIFEIYNFGGILIHSGAFIKEQAFKHLEINVSNYKSGIYTYSIFMKSSRINSGKFIIE